MDGPVVPDVAGAASASGVPATGDSEGPRVARLGLVVNPVAGVGGAVGLKGSDGMAVVRRALELGAVPHSGERAAVALASLAARWPAGVPMPVLITAPEAMGGASARKAGLAPSIVGDLPAGETSAEDTRRLVGAIAAEGVDLLLFAGGDGTARDVAGGLPAGTPVLGIPAGVKIHSAVFATGPAAAGILAADFLVAPPARRRTALREVLDLDEDAYRRGEIAPRLHGELPVPVEGRRLQARKAPSPESEAAAAAGIADEIVRALPPGGRYVLGPGSTTRAVADRLGVAKTLVGVDVIEVDGAGRAHLVAADAGEGALLTLVAEQPLRLIVTPIGGQGFLLGRGNQQIGPGVVRAALEAFGRDGIVIIATSAKLAALRGRPLLVDSGDPVLDASLAGHQEVITGRGERTFYRVEPA